MYLHIYFCHSCPLPELSTCFHPSHAPHPLHRFQTNVSIPVLHRDAALLRHCIFHAAALPPVGPSPCTLHPPSTHITTSHNLPIKHGENRNMITLLILSCPFNLSDDSASQYSNGDSSRHRPLPGPVCRILRSDGQHHKLCSARPLWSAHIVSQAPPAPQLPSTLHRG